MDKFSFADVIVWLHGCLCFLSLEANDTFFFCSLTTALILLGWLISTHQSLGRSASCWLHATNCSGNLLITDPSRKQFKISQCEKLDFKTIQTYMLILGHVFRDRPVLIVHGDKREAKARLLQQAQPFPHVRFCQVPILCHRIQSFHFLWCKNIQREILKSQKRANKLYV